MDFGGVLNFVSVSGTSTSATASRPCTTTFFLLLFGYLINQAQQAAAGIVEFAFVPTLASMQGMNLPTWMLNELFLLGAGLLMAAEWYSEDNADFRVMFEDAKTNLLKPGVAVLLQFGLVQGQGAAVMELLALHLPEGALFWLATLGPGVAIATTGAISNADLVAQSGVLGWLVTLVAGGWALLMGFGTWLLATVRQGVIELISDLDDGDSLGLMRIVSLAEGGWTVVLMIILVTLPMLALGLAGLTILSLFLIRKWFERREERSKVACPTCSHPMFPTALFCPSCRQPNPAPHNVGMFGQVKTTLVSDPTAHRIQLTARKRCPSCATRLPEKVIHQSCPSCATVTFDDISAVNSYLRALDKRLPATLIICGVLGAVPLLGLVPGIIYYRLSLIASLRTYIPSAVGCFTRWGIRLATLVLIALQPFFLGWLTLPAMALLNYVVYRQVLRAGAGGLAQAPVPVVGQGDEVTG
jgi:Zn finger protein HypA/HybF involved in hydrogenase expression